MELPGLCAGWFALGALSSFFRSHDQGRLARFPSYGQSFLPDGLQHFAGVLQDPGGCDHMIIRHGNAYLVVAELQGELSTAKKLLVLPACIIGVGAEAWIPVGDFKQSCAIVEFLVPRTCADALGVIDQIGPADLEVCARAAD